jgi:hypothetical protein
MIGYRRIEMLEREYREKGYFVLTHPLNNTGIDMVIIMTSTAKVVEVLEVTNYARKEEYINNRKFIRYLTTLNEFNFGDIKKTIVVSFRENLNENQIRLLKQCNIEIRVMGYQD